MYVPTFITRRQRYPTPTSSHYISTPRRTKISSAFFYLTHIPPLSKKSSRSTRATPQSCVESYKRSSRTGNHNHTRCTAYTHMCKTTNGIHALFEGDIAWNQSRPAPKPSSQATASISRLSKNPPRHTPAREIRHLHRAASRMNRTPSRPTCLF